VKRDVAFSVCLLLILACGLAIRLPRLDARPMHADEAVQAARFRDLWLEGTYRYDPHEYHGPTLNYFTLPIMWVSRPADFGETTETMYRIVPVLFGAGLVLLLFGLRASLGHGAALWAGLFTAVSPAMVFYSRYYIHETLLVFFTLVVMISAWRYWQTGKMLWSLCVGAGVGLMQATKETAPLSLLAMILATTLMVALRGGVSPNCREIPTRRRVQHAVAAILAAAIVAALWYSSFLTNPIGIRDSVLTYAPWLKRAAGVSPHVHPWYFYFQRLAFWRVGAGPVFSEAAILLIGLAGWLCTWMPGTNDKTSSASREIVRWLGWYTMALAAIYSAIPYKTPWCLLGFHHATILLAGFGASTIGMRLRHIWLRAAWNLAVLVAVMHLGAQAYRASFLLPADLKNPYVYAQTLPDVLRLTEDLRAISSAGPAGSSTTVKVLWQDPYYWPLPWYLRNMKRVGYWSELPQDAAAPLIIATPQYDEELTKRLDATHLMTGYYAIRPNLLAELWVSMDLWECHLRKLGRLK
jgi:uncharacterized protein (TIGR03663 family)